MLLISSLRSNMLINTWKRMIQRVDINLKSEPTHESVKTNYRTYLNPLRHPKWSLSDMVPVLRSFFALDLKENPMRAWAQSDVGSFSSFEFSWIEFCIKSNIVLKTMTIPKVQRKNLKFSSESKNINMSNFQAGLTETKCLVSSLAQHHWRSSWF